MSYIVTLPVGISKKIIAFGDGTLELTEGAIFTSKALAETYPQFFIFPDATPAKVISESVKETIVKEPEMELLTEGPSTVEVEIVPEEVKPAPKKKAPAKKKPAAKKED